MEQKLQIKRSTGTSAPPTLKQGELAYSKGSQTFYIGDPAAENTPLAIGPAITNDAGVVALVVGVTPESLRALLELASTDNVAFQDLTVAGNLVVQGTTTTVNSDELNIADNVIVLNSNAAGVPIADAGVEVERGDAPNVLIKWNEGTDRFEFTNDGTTFYNIPVPSEYDTGTGAEGDITSVTITSGDGSIAGAGTGTDGDISFDLQVAVVDGGTY